MEHAMPLFGKKANEASLRETKKLQNLRRGKTLVERIHTIQRAGLEVWSGIILCFDSDDASIFDAQRQFLREAEDSVREFFAAVGSIDHLIVTASSVRTGTLKDLSLADGEFTFRSKFFGPYLCAKYARMKPTGSITFFSGILSRRPGHNDVVLAGVNAAVEAMGRALARDLAPIRVNTISPGMTRGTSAYLSMPEAAREGMYSSIATRLPLGRVGTPEDIANATLMLMTNGFITGVTLDVDGGGVLV